MSTAFAVIAMSSIALATSSEASAVCLVMSVRELDESNRVPEEFFRLCF
ncbi:hypothetical protein [Clostridium estertheticum]|uniref:Cyclic lactone autoinducer peptide n=1 Tax=Clostridium estertheticum TaxID=238834 RepID=A0A7Y3SYY1_9CLOT|nr:hypothetical protein [Clostridium estertheticum]NNU77762.1 hypothetical protein [Clostridium estertheticum]WBL45535.1 hypothetical protein LOR37_12590 [Clostridium estertheticum]